MKFFFDVDPSVMLGITIAAIIAGLILLVYLGFRYQRSVSIEADVDLSDRRAKIKLDSGDPHQSGKGGSHVSKPAN